MSVHLKVLRELRTSVRLEFIVDHELQPSPSRFELQWRPKDVTEWQTASADLPGPTCTKGGLQPGSTYVFRARAVGESFGDPVEASTPCSAGASAATVPTPPPIAIGLPGGLLGTRLLSHMSDEEVALPSFYDGKGMADALRLAPAAFPPLGPSPLLAGESEADEGAVRRHTKNNSWLTPGAHMRLVVLYGMGGFAVSLRELWRSAPPWLEVRPLELPGHGFLSKKPLPLLPGSPTEIQPSPPTKLSHITTARDKLISALADELMPLLRGGRTALYGFSNGAMIMYLITIELMRRQAVGFEGVELPIHLFVAGRGAVNRIATIPIGTMLSQLQADDDQTVAWAQSAGVLAPGQKPVNAKQFSSLVRSDFGIGIPEVGTRPPEPEHDGSEARPTVDTGVGRFTEDAPKVSMPLTAILSDGDTMWPREIHQHHWAALAGSAFTEAKIEDVPHGLLQAAPQTRHAVFSALAKHAKALFAAVDNRENS